MPIYARIDNGILAEIRDIDAIPPHKESLWRPVVIEGDGPRETTIVEPTQVRIVRSGQDLSEQKAAATTKVNADAEAQRLHYLTPGIGQSMTYQQKLDEARMILVDDAATTAADAMTPDELKATYPMIWASIPADGKTASVVAASVHGKALAWAQIGAQIEKKRRDALDAIAAAATPEQVAAAAAVEW